MASTEPNRGTCFGFEVHSSLVFGQLRDGGGAELTVTEVSEDPVPTGPPLLRWERSSGQPFDARLHSPAEGLYQLWLEECGWFVIDTESAVIAIPGTGNPVRREERLWGLPALLAFLDRGDVPVHGASVAAAGRAMLLAGPSMHGKTTLAGAFIDSGHDLLSGDLSCVRLGDTGATVLPGPAALRVRRDVTEYLEMKQTRVVFEDERRVHYVINERARSDGEPVDLAGIVLLTGESEKTELKLRAPAESLPDLWLLSFDLPTPDGRARKLSQLAALADRVPIWSMTRPMTPGALRETVTEIVDVVLADVD